MEILYFTIVAVVLYIAADWLLDRIEIGLGRRLEKRSLIFFAILATMALLSFWLIRAVAA